MLLYVKLTTGIRALIAILTEYTVFGSRIRDTCLPSTHHPFRPDIGIALAP